MTDRTACSACGAELEANVPACPECGSGDRFISLAEFVGVRDDLHTKGVTPNLKGGKPLEVFKLRTQLSKSTKREAIKKITIDRSRGKTRTRDEVWEKDELGRWFKVHGHFK